MCLLQQHRRVRRLNVAIQSARQVTFLDPGYNLSSLYLTLKYELVVHVIASSSGREREPPFPYLRGERDGKAQTASGELCASLLLAKS